MDYFTNTESSQDFGADSEKNSEKDDEKYMRLAGIAAQTSVVEENVPPARNSDYINIRR